MNGKQEQAAVWRPGAQKLVWEALRGGWVFKSDSRGSLVETMRPSKTAAAVIEECLPIIRDDLRLGRVEVKVFQPGSERIRGLVHDDDPHVIWLKSGQTVADTLETLAHEMKHSRDILDVRAGLHAPYSDEEDERRADLYGKKIRKMYEGEAA